MTDLAEWAAERPLFTVDEAQRATGLGRASLLERLSRMTRRGDLRRVERGKYTAHDDPVVYATYVETPSYLSFWSGLRFYDLTTQQPTGVQVVCAVNRHDLPSISFYSASDLLGFGRERYDRFEVFVAEEERLLLDCLSRDVVPVSELGELVAAVDVDVAVEYADRLGRKAVKKRLGYLLEVVRDRTVEALQVPDRNYPLLDLTRPAEGETDARWRIRVNADVV